MLVKERELAEARARLAAIKDLKYKNRKNDDNFEGYGNGTIKRMALQGIKPVEKA